MAEIVQQIIALMRRSLEGRHASVLPRLQVLVLSLTNTAQDEFPLLAETLLIEHGVVRQLCLVGGGAETETFRDLVQYVQLKEGLPHDLDL